MSGTMRDKTNDLQGFRFAWPFPKNPSFFYKLKSNMMMTSVTMLSKLAFIGGLNTLTAYNRDRFLYALNSNKPMITVSNHRCNIDDPLIWSILSLREFWKYKTRHRYTLAAHNICFTKQLHTTLFSLGRCVPCVRGEGVYQKGMDFCIEMLNRNNWIHIFPEGRVCYINEEPKRFKWGVGRLIMDCETQPLIIPIWIKNMEKIWPTSPPYYPKFGYDVEVHIGEPFGVEHLKRVISQRKELTTEQKRKIITDEIQTRMYNLGEEVGDLNAGSSQKLLQKYPPINY